MTSENYMKAVELTSERMALTEDLEAWRKIKGSNQLMYHGENGEPGGFVGNFHKIAPKDIFDKFRDACVERLNSRLVEIDNEFAAL